MPLFTFENEDHRRRVVTAAGYDPEKFTFNTESGIVEPYIKETPTISAPQVENSVPDFTPVATPEKYSGPGTFIRHAVRSAPAGLVGLPAGIATTQALAPFFATPATAWIPPVAGIGVGVGSALLADKFIVDPAVKKYAPEFQKQLIESQQEDPNQAFIGQLAGGLITGKPSLTSAVSAGRTLGRLGQKAIGAEIPAIARAELANLADVGVGGAIPAGQETYNALTGDEPFSLGQAAVNVGSGLLFNKLNPLGRKIARVKGHDESFDNRRVQDKIGDTLGRRVAGESSFAELAAKKRIEEELLNAAKYLEENPLGQDAQLAKVSKKYADKPEEKEKGLFDVAASDEGPRVYYSQKDSGNKYSVEGRRFINDLRQVFPEFVTEKGKLKTGGIYDEDTLREFLDKKRYGEEFDAYQEARKELAEYKEKKNYEEVHKQLGELLDVRRFGDYEKEVALVKKINEDLERRGLAGKNKENLIVPQVQKPVVTESVKATNEATKKESNYQLFRELMKKGDFKAASDMADEGFLARLQAERRGEPDVPFTTKTKIETELPTNRNAIGMKGKTFFQPESSLKKQAAVTGKDKRLRLTKSLYNFFSENLGPIRNVKLEQGELRTDSGKPISGIAFARDGLKAAVAKINPEVAGADTPGHEMIHLFLDDLKSSPKTSDKKLWKNLIDSTNRSEALAKYNEGRETKVDADEFLVERTGLETVKQLLNIDSKNGTFRRGWENFISGLKTKWSKNADISDFERVLSNKFLNDPSFVERYGSDNFVPKTKQVVSDETKKQEGSELNERIPNRQEKENETSAREISERPAEVEREPSSVRPTDDSIVKAKATGEETKPAKSDYDQYVEVQGKFRELMKQGKGLEDPEMQALWKENETIKNRHGGMPPAAPKQEVKTQEKSTLVGKKYQESSSLSDQTNTPEFKKWFGDSKVVDKEGRPLRVYHGTTKNFTAFRKQPKRGNFFTSEPVGADSYTHGDGGNIKPVYLSLKNPAKYEDLSERMQYDLKHKSGYEKTQREVFEYLRAKGYDGFIWGRNFIAFEPTQIKSATGNQGTFDPTNPDIRFQESSSLAQGKTPEEILANFSTDSDNPIYRKQNIFRRTISELPLKAPLFSSDLDKASIRLGKSGAELAPALREVFNLTDEYLGKYKNPTMEALRKLTPDERDEYQRIALASSRSGTDYSDQASPNVKIALDEIRKVLTSKQKDQIAADQPVQEFVPNGKGGYTLQMRLPKVNPLYHPEVVDGKKLEILLNAPGSQAFAQLKNDFVEHIKTNYDLSSKEALELFEDLVASYGGSIQANQTRFGAVNKAEGIGLPDSWIEKDPVLALDRYWKRTARARAFHDAIQIDPKMLWMLGYKKDAWGRPITEDLVGEGYNKIAGNEHIRRVMDIIQGQNVKTNPTLDAYSKVAINAILGPLTGINDAFAAPFLMAKFAPSTSDALLGAMNGIKSLSQNIRNAKSTGRIKDRIADFENVFSVDNTHVENIRKLGDGLSKITGRAKLEEFSRGISQGMSEYLVTVHQKLAENGNETSAKLLDGLANGKSGLDVKTLASRMMDLTQGTYDPRGLPSWAIDSQIAPILRLARWNIESANNFYKHVLLPAKAGNYTPLILTMFGASAGGLILKELREKLSGKKLNIPSLQELSASSRGLEGNIPAVAYNLMAGLSYIGALGTFGEIGKAGFDMAFKNKPQGYNYPLIELLGDGVDNISKAASALANGEDILNVSKTFAEQTILNQLQVGRIAKNHFENATGDIERTGRDERRDLRMYRIGEGLPYAAQAGSSGFDPYTGTNVREFKKTPDFARARQLTPALIQEAKDKSKGDVEEYRRKLSGYKRNAVQTFPSPESNPKGFVDYKNYLERLLGKKEAGERVKKYVREKQMNRAKNLLIP